MRAFILCGQPALATMLETHLSALGVPASVHAKPNPIALDLERPTPAIAIVDWPGSFDALREHCRSLRAGPGGQNLLILALAPDLTPMAECQALECGCDDVLAKPLNVDLLVLRLKRILDQAAQRHPPWLAEGALASREAAAPARTAPRPDASGGIAGVAATVEGIASRVLSNEALKSDQRLLRTILDTLPEGVFVKDLAGRYRLVNRCHAELYGLAPEDFLGRRTAELGGAIGPGRLARIEASDRQVLEEGNVVEYVDEWLYRSATGKESFERVVKAPLRDEGGQIVGLVGLREDITARKKAEDERLALERLMQRTQNLESLGAMAGSIAHDFNNLLQGILGYAELALLEAEAGSPVSSSVQMIHDAGVSAVELTKQMLTLSGRSRLALEAVDLDALAETGAAQLRRTLAPGLELNLVRGSGTPAVMADAALLRQVLHSLVSNSAEAMTGSAGQITLTTGALTLKRGRLDDSFSDWDVEQGLYGYLEVRDTGPGIPDEVRARLFEPFVSTKSMGRGLGLAAVRGIVRGHRGTIQALSAQGAGATFRILLPSADPRSVPEESPEGI